MTLIVNEIFYSFQGETVMSGLTSIFIRLTGCNLKCKYCDTKYSRVQGRMLSFDSIINAISKMKAHHITITGGEPLCQEEAIPFMHRLVSSGYRVQLETNGSMNMKLVPSKVRKIIDVKTPSSSEEGSFLMDNLKYINDHDEIKFVISDNNDFNFAKEFMTFYLAETKAVINFSPTFGMMSPDKLGDLILKSQLQVRLNLQLHKILWMNEKDNVINIPLDHL